MVLQKIMLYNAFMIKVFILNAGIGSRLLPNTQNSPKCLLRIHGKETILSLQLKALEKAGFMDIYILTGYHHEMIEDYLKNRKSKAIIRTVYFPFFNIANNLMTLWSSRHLFSKDIIIINGDNVFEWKVLKKLKHQDNLGCLLANKKEKYDEDDMLIISNKKRLLQVGKKLSKTKATGESIGIMRFCGESVQILIKTLEEIVINNVDAHKLWYLFAVSEMANKNSNVNVEYINELYWAEIDFPQDLTKVIKRLNNNGNIIDKRAL